MSVDVLILHASGTNRDREAAWACQLAGGQPEIVHVNQLATGQRRLADYGMLVLPGGFSYGDALGAGKLLGLALRHTFQDDLTRLHCRRAPGAGYLQRLPGAGQGRFPAGRVEQQATLTFNASARFECRWVTLVPDPDSPASSREGCREPIDCPVAHGEGRLSQPTALGCSRPGRLPCAMPWRMDSRPPAAILPTPMARRATSPASVMLPAMCWA